MGMYLSEDLANLAREVKYLTDQELSEKITNWHLNPKLKLYLKPLIDEHQYRQKTKRRSS